MGNVYIKKSLLIVFTFFVSALFVDICSAAPVSPTEDDPIQIQSVADFTSIDPVVKHSTITTVLANGILNAKVSTLFGDAIAADLVLEYKIDSGEVIEVKKENIANKRDYYLGTPEGAITKDNEYVDYRIKGVFTIDGEENPFVVYVPTQLDESSTTFAKAKVVSKIEQTIDGSSGGNIEVFCGDQSKGDKGTVIVSVPADAYSGEQNVVVDFLAESESSSDAASRSKQNILSTVSVDVDGVSEINNPIQIKNLPLQTKAQANKFSMQYQDGTEWVNAVGSNLSVDKPYQLYSFSATNLGFYRVIENLVLSNNNYRPKNRIVVKAKVGNSYPGFEFKYLKEGDVVKIYNLKGKKIAELKSNDISSDGFVWKGKKGTDNSGDWAESGTYVYQIKLKDGGDVISGTIAFVW